MKPEPDAVAIDLISRLTKCYSELLWYYSERHGAMRCHSCFRFRATDEHPVHNEGCLGVQMILESLYYVSNNA